MVRHAFWLPAVRAGEWTDAQTGVHSNLRGRERVNPQHFPRASGRRGQASRLDDGFGAKTRRYAPWFGPFYKEFHIFDRIRKNL